VNSKVIQIQGRDNYMVIDAAFNEEGDVLFAWAIGRKRGALFSWKVGSTLDPELQSEGYYECPAVRRAPSR
jgi:hypothetical protein